MNKRNLVIHKNFLLIACIFIYFFKFQLTFLFSLQFNILTQDVNHGGGKDVDIAIISRELQRLGHHVSVFDIGKQKKINKADVNIFLAQCSQDFFSKAKYNWFVPNPEFLNVIEVPKSLLKEFDLILCKTQETLRIFDSYFNNTYFLGFTTFDKLQPEIEKKFNHYLHVAGKSRMKGTDEIAKVWFTSSIPMPQLTLIRHSRHSKFPNIPEVNLIKRRVSEETILLLQNECGIHLCPSKAEGFGHYIMEAMSAEAVVITTDAPPMNEHIQDSRCLVKFKKKERQNLGRLFTVDERKLALAIKRLQKLSAEELREIGKKNREEFLLKDRQFRENFEVLIEQTENRIKKSPYTKI